MKTQEEQLEILFCRLKGLSYRAIARRNGCDARTAKKYVDHPELIASGRPSRGYGWLQLKPMEGLEPPTRSLRKSCSTPEPHRHGLFERKLWQA